MINMTKKIELTGYSVIDGVNVEFHLAKINSDNPNKIEISSSILDTAMYKANRTQCRADEAEFEDVAYELQDELIAEMQADTETSDVE